MSDEIGLQRDSLITIITITITLIKYQTINCYKQFKLLLMDDVHVTPQAYLKRSRRAIKSKFTIYSDSQSVNENCS